MVVEVQCTHILSKMPSKDQQKKALRRQRYQHDHEKVKADKKQNYIEKIEDRKAVSRLHSKTSYSVNPKKKKQAS